MLNYDRNKNGQPGSHNRCSGAEARLRDKIITSKQAQKLTTVQKAILSKGGVRYALKTILLLWQT